MTTTSTPSPVLIGFGTTYYHALGGTIPISLHHSDDELEVNGRIMKDPPWNNSDTTNNGNENDALVNVTCTTTSTIFLTKKGHVYQSGTFHGRQWISPTKVEIPYPRKCVEVAAGRHFCIGRLEHGIGVVSWGAGHFGQLGLGPHVSRVETPHLIPHLLPQAMGGVGSTRVQQIAAGAWHALALLENGKVMAWGSNRKYQCGINKGGASSSSSPTLVYPQPMELHGTVFQKVACGKCHSLGLEQDTGRVYAWGANQHGQCGVPPYTSRKTTTTTSVNVAVVTCLLLVEALQRVVVVDISAGDSHSLACTGGGRVFGWGNGIEGQLGLGGILPWSRPRLLVDLDFVAIQAGREWKLQQQQQQQLESNSTAQQQQQQQQQQQSSSSSAHVSRLYTSSPIQGSTTTLSLHKVEEEEARGVPGAEGEAAQQRAAFQQLSQVPKIVKVLAGQSYSVAISSSGHVYAWGYNDVGQLGLPKSSTELPFCELTSSSSSSSRTLSSSSDRLLQIRSFESQHNVLLPIRVDALAQYNITNVAVGPCHLWCMGTERPKEKDDTVVVGRTLYEAQEGRRRKSMLRLRKHLSSSTCTSTCTTTTTSSSLPSSSSLLLPSATIISPIQEQLNNPPKEKTLACENPVLLRRDDTIGSEEEEEDGNSSETPSLGSPIGSTMLTPTSRGGGEHSSSSPPTKTLAIPEMESSVRMISKEGSEPKNDAFPELSSPIHGIQPSATGESAETTEQDTSKADAAAAAAPLGRSNSFPRKSLKNKGRSNENDPKLVVGSDEGGDPTPAPCRTNSPPTCAVVEPPPPLPCDNHDDEDENAKNDEPTTDTTTRRTLSFGKSISRLIMPGKQRISNPDHSKPKKGGRLRKAIHSTFYK